MADTDTQPLLIEQFDLAYRVRMILAYPVIAGMTVEQLYTTPRTAKDWAFQRVLNARNLQPTHLAYLTEVARMREELAGQ